MKHNLLKSVILSVILLLGANSVWAWTISNAKIYYDDSNSNWSENVVVAFEKSDGGAVKSMSKIANTKLHYWTGSWGDGQVSYMRFGKTTSTYDWYGWWTDVKNTWSLSTADSWSGVSNGWGLDINNSYKMFGASSSDKGADLTKTDLTSYTSLNFNQTITIQNYNTSNSKFEASNNTAGTVAAKYYKFSSANSVGTQQSASITNSTAISAAYTSTMTLTASAKSGYQFVGWYDGTTLLSKNTTYSHTVPNSTKTIYARFIKIDALNVPVYLKTGDWKSDGARFAVYAFEDNSGFQMWIDMSELDCSGSRDYFTCKVPANTKVIFCRMNPENATNDWTNKYNQTANLTVSTNNYWKFTAWHNNSDGNDEGTWTAYTAPTYTVTLVADSHGTYNVKSGNTTTTSKLSGNVTMNVALNSKITITTNTPQPGYDQSQGAAITIGKNDKQKATLGTEYTICGPTTITGNFVSTEEQVVYLQPTGHWNGNNAQYKAFVFHDTGSKWMNSLMNNVTCETDDQACYTCTLPEGYHSVIFCRVKDNTVNSFSNGNLWNQTNDLAIPVKSENNCYKITAIGSLGEKSSGNWKTYSTPTYSVTLEPTPYGTYNVEYNGRTYKSSDKNTITIPDVPVGAIVHITDCQPYNNEYTNAFILQTNSSGDDIIEAEQEYTHTICGNTTINENFVTKNPHVVYLRVPTSLDASWNANGSKNFVYSYNDIKKGETGYVREMAEYDIQDSEYTYYTCTIPADCHTFRFERKNNANESALQKTVSFTHAMPFNGMNCFTITNSGDEYTGYWDILLTNGDYRLLYVEQVVEKSKVSGDEWKTVVTRKKAHPSDIIKKGTPSQIVSLHIYKERTYMANAGGSEYKSSNNPEIILQQYNSSTKTWENKERHMVFGPLQTLPGMAMAPGRRNVAANAELVYDDGIEIIKKDDHADAGSGVWNFTVTQSNGVEPATIDLTQTRRYNEETDGPYYIRTDVANGNWYNYTNPDNHMTRSDVSKQHSNYSHYFCKWVESENNVNVKFTIANKYGYAISDTLEADRTDLWGVELTEAQKMVNGQVLPKHANVRFTWNEKSNLIHRAYIAGSSNVSDRFLVLKANDNNVGIFDDKDGNNNLNISGLNTNEQIFVDNSNWIYHADVHMLPGAEVQVTAKYNEKTQYFVGKEGEFSNTVLQGVGEQKYLIRLLYDFKTNELISAYVPGGQAGTEIEAIETNLMLIRKGNEPASQLAFNTKLMDETGKTAYGVIEFPFELLTDNTLDIYKRSLYWISFPFDVNLKDAFSFGQYGVHWLIQEYDGASRAEKGLWAESDTYWKLHWDPTNIVLEAGKGYVIEIDIARIRTDYATTFNKKGHSVAIYFPSKEPISSKLVQNPDAVTIDVPEHTCTIPIRDTPYGNRQIRDSHWNVIGVPSYINAGATFSNPVMPLVGDRALKYYYRWDGFDNYSPQTAENNHTYASNFQSMFAYMVQYAGNLTWNSVVSETTPAAIAAKKNSDNIEEHHLRLELLQNGSEVDRTFVQMREDDVTPAFDFNHDLCKITNKGLANIYSLITTETYPIEVAANVLPIQETVIPVGVVISTAGEYTFAMPDGTDGIVVELIDYETNTRTNMLLDEYTINLGKGTFENRFALHVKPDKTTTSLEGINTNSNGVRKFIIDGTLYMQKDGVLYDAQGRCVR